MKPSELRDKTVEELQTELVALLKEQFSLRLQKGSGQPPQAHMPKQVKTDIARLKTILHQKGCKV